MIALSLAAAAATGIPGEVQGCLDRIDTDCADRALVALGAERSSDPDLLAALAETRFYEGDYPAAHDAMKRAVEAGWVDTYEELPLYERTLYATANWVEESRGRFAVRIRPGLDAMLVDDAFTAIGGSDRHIAPLLGGSPPGVSRVELFPDRVSFIAASSLQEEDVETTGVVGLAKWSRLLVASPRMMSRGYPWQDTIAHEYVHLIVTHHTADRSPVWLQEAIAKYLDARWRDGADRFRLTARQQGLLAEALRKDDLVTFEEMHPSLAKLPTAERAALAYAQLATLMQYCFTIGGDEVLLRVLPNVRDGMDPRDALALGAGAADFPTLLQGWRTWIEQQPLVEKHLAELPTVLEGGDDMDLDPLLSEREDLARFVTLGDILREHGEVEASLVEYAKAVPKDEPPSPLLSNRIAQAELALGHVDKARRALEESLADYPEFSLTLKTLGQIAAKQGAFPEARERLRDAVAIHPFDPELHALLVEVSKKLGDEAGAERHTRALEIRAHGGDDVERPVLHTTEGEIVLPSYASRERQAPEALREAWVGEEARPFPSVVDLKGETVRLADYAGKVVVVDFWATWCGPCKEAIPHLAELWKANKDEGLVVLGITQEDAARVRGWLARNPIPYDVGIDLGGRTNALYDVSALPTVFVVDRTGRVREVVVGGGQAAVERIEAAVERALEGEE